MKWPVAGLEARLRASLKRFFCNSYYGSRKTKSNMNTTPTFSDRDSHGLHRPKCNTFGSDGRWVDKESSALSLEEYRSNSLGRHNQSENTGHSTKRTRTHGLWTSTPRANWKKSSKDLLKSDVSVNTEPNISCQYQDAYSQAEFGELADLEKARKAESVEHGIVQRPHMINASTEPIVLSYSDGLQSNPEESTQHCLNSFLQNLPVGPIKGGMTLVTRHCSDPFIFNHTKSFQQQLTDEVNGNYIYTGDAYLRHTNSSTGCLSRTGESPNCVTQWSFDAHVHPYTTVLEHAVESRNKLVSAEVMEDRRSFYEGPHTSIPRTVRNCYTHQVQHYCPPVFQDETQSILSDGRRFNSELCIPSTLSQSHVPSHIVTKPTKECGDECQPAAARHETTDSTKTAYVTNSPLCPTACSVVITDELSNSCRQYGAQSNPHRSRCSSDHLHTPAPIKGRNVTGPCALGEYDPATDSLGDRRVSGSQSGKQLNTTGQRRPGLSRLKGSFKKDFRPNMAYSFVRKRSAEKNVVRHAEDTQMIHHNCTVLPKDATSQFSEKSEHSSKKYALFPHSTSDDGDPSKLVRLDRSIDRSSASSSLAYKLVHSSKGSTQPIVKRPASRSPSQARKSHKQEGGALPATKDPNLCPTGKHLDVKKDKPCICMMVKRMVFAQSKPVLYSWHIKLQKTISGQHLSGPGVVKHPDGSLEVDCRAGTPSSCSLRSNIPTLPNYQLARPTRMVRGGQGTVAWVTNVTTGHFYALKFKHRDGRSENTWAIERREAKLLRHARHDFIVRLFHIYETEETLFMALEWLDGGCLWNHIARSGTMPECYAIYYTACILSALRYLHSIFIVYRDMKAENVVLDQRGRPKLIDFGMAKRFPAPAGSQGRRDSAPNDDSVRDSEDFDQPPTRYYFAAYLAPEIYDHSEVISQYIDSWGLGYILVEMLLGYGIFLPMPWEKDPGQHLSEHWKLTLPNDATLRLSPVCDDFVHKMLLRNPHERLSLEDAEKHNFFARVPWTNLAGLRGPDLSKCPPKGTAVTHTATTSSGARRWMTKYDPFIHVPDLAFVREFFGSVVNPNVIYTTQTFGLNSRRTKITKVLQTKGSGLSTDVRRSNLEADRYRPVSGMTRARNGILSNAIEIRGTQASTNEVRKEAPKSNRNGRRSGVSVS
ncbi:Kinase domain protein [Paragonimus heterotremus]|uniref:Serine/threonine-protein kinase greatwall n=1 Tax=Paragonimus heterotremus TaxID=100268 RepID=A0A8J4WVC1_9TREM|nr:Kinase domain protein [Paragonimus heterotremus]